MINMTVGPVAMYDEVLTVAGQPVPYFRTSEFSTLMLENESMFLKMINAPANSRCVFLTTSGSGAMESCVSNLLTPSDNVAVINGGSFGKRFADLCSMYQIPHTEVRCEFGKPLVREQLDSLADSHITALLVNMHETSSGILYDMKMIADFCRSHSIFLIVDAISSFLADEISMRDLGANVVLTASQKALALQPGMSIVAMDEKALERVDSNPEKNMYLSLKAALVNMERGQTPFTPAVSICYQLNARLKMIERNGGVSSESAHIRSIAMDLRSRIGDLPFDLLVEDPANRSNAVTALVSRNGKAGIINRKLIEDYGIWICPNGGDIRDTIFRVGHIGNLTIEDNDRLIEALEELKKKENI
jgi:aspartate aminotransferase-like enzyme